jgi:hypothetical protein
MMEKGRLLFSSPHPHDGLMTPLHKEDVRRYENFISYLKQCKIQSENLMLLEMR